MSKEQTTPEPETVDVAGFDLEAWVAGAVQATETVQVSSRAGLADRLVALVKSHEEASQKKARAAVKRAEIDDLAEQIRQVAAELEGSWVEVKFTAPTPTQRREAFKGTSDDGSDGEQRVANLLERVGRLRPVGAGDDAWQSLQAAGWMQIFDVIGSGQYDIISTKMAALAFTKGVTPGFSQRALSYLGTRPSGQS